MEVIMVTSIDGPQTLAFAPISLAGGHDLAQLRQTPDLAETTRAAVDHAPWNQVTAWGLPFEVHSGFVVSHQSLSIAFALTTAPWLVFMHTAELAPLSGDTHGMIRPMTGEGRLNQHMADYVILYGDGQEERLPVRSRHQIGAFTRRWGENCFQAVAHHKPQPVRPHHEQMTTGWGASQTRVNTGDRVPWVNWLWAWKNPRPTVPIVGIRLEPQNGVVILFGLCAGTASSHPLRWEPRKKAVASLPSDFAFEGDLSPDGLLDQIQLDMGQVISAQLQDVYPDDWSGSYNNQLPQVAHDRILIEYTAHADAAFHLWDGSIVALADVQRQATQAIVPVAPSAQRVTLRVLDRATGRPVPVKLHVHGEAGEYLAPLDRHRIPNPAWFEDYAPEFIHRSLHACTYIDGETRIDLPLGRVHIEVSKGFEIRPIRRTLEITAETQEITLEIERVLPWRSRGWVTADTHVHFLSPMTGLLEGSAEGVNIVNLLASQWGELMTNVGDFDGTNTWGSKETGSDGEYLLRVGTENRQHVLGHISLLGYKGRPIVPMTTGGPNESALGDPIDVLLTEWARQCHRQGGLVVLPHFPNPRAEHAAAIVEGDIDAIEMTSWGNLYGGIDPYSLSDWYRYLNCGYLVPCVGGTDKMDAMTAVGTVRTYARLQPGEEISYDGWMQAVRRANTFVTYGPLIEFQVGGQSMGSRISLNVTGGTLDVTWQVASVTVPMSRVDLVVNGEIRESVMVPADKASGSWSLPIDTSSWVALLVRGHHADQPEIVAAHSSPVMVTVGQTPFFAAADAITILDQIEGALVYLDTLGTRKDNAAYRRMRLVLQSAHRRIHNRLHAQGYYHDHTATEDHAEHHH
jgi:hypothetical protein